jgi:protein-disulfide isomerase
MNETTGTGVPSGSSGNSPLLIYVLCAVVGLAVGVLGAMAFLGGGGSGGGDPVVAEFNGKSVRASEAFTQVKPRLFEIEEELFRTKEQAINEFIEQRLLDAESKKQNIPVDQLVEKEMGATPAEVTDKDIEEFLTSKGLSLTDPRIRKDDVKDYLKYRKKFEKRQAFVAKLRQGAKVKLMIKEPESPKINVAIEGFPTWGNAKAPVTIVEFSDFQCPFCSRALPVLDKIKQEYGPDKVKIVFIDTPLPSHPRAIPASLAAHCAEEQGKFWEYHNALFSNQAKLEDADLKDQAKTIGLDTKKFAECFDSKKHQATIDKAKREGEK